MQLLLHCLLRIVIVTALCLAGAGVIILHGAHRDMEAATSAGAEHAVERMRALYWQALLWRDGLDRVGLLPQPQWRTLETAAEIAPGTCLSFAAPSDDPATLCNRSIGFAPPAPAWFVALDRRLFGEVTPVNRRLDVRSQRVGTVTVSADPVSALALAWAKVHSTAIVATTIAAVLAVSIGLVVARALLPIGTIVERLRDLESGGPAVAAETRAPFELGRITDAIEALARRLARTEAARGALTRRLFQVQEEERRALARDLHDEFGQCLTAAGACAASIEAGASDRHDLVADARAIGALVERMMVTVRGALVRLRSQDVDELGLEEALRGMAARIGAGGGTRVSLDVTGDLTLIPSAVSIELFRIAQECLTNAKRHAGASHVAVAVRAAAPSVVLSVEDDGGGETSALERDGGRHGLLGIRERVAALGGELAIVRAARGIRVAATLPLGPTAPA